MIEITAEYLSSQGLSETFPQRFWSKVHKTDSCWIWEGCKSSGGHGNIAAGRPFKKCLGAHMASWILNVGPIPVGLCVLHNCPGGDNPACVNPKHLWIGTKQQNTQDAVNKGTWKRDHQTYYRGEQHHGHIVKTCDIIEIRRLSDSKEMNQRQLAKRFNISFQHVNRIVLRQTWKHVP